MATIDGSLFLNNSYLNKFDILSVNETSTEININMKVKLKSDKCPCCGVESSQIHTTYQRRLLDTPFHNKQVKLHITSYKFNCVNEHCTRKVFKSEIGIAGYKKVRTYWLDQFILSIACFVSSNGTSEILKKMNIDVSHDTVDRIINNVVLNDNPDIEEVGIDDIAYRKGHTYCTSIYDMKTHQLVALLDGRTSDTLKEWLKTHDKIKVVTRDRASAYAKAINEILPKCTQVADKFHLMSNLLDNLKDIFYTELPDKIFIKDGKILEKEPKKVPIELNDLDVLDIKNFDYDNCPPINPVSGEK